MIHNPPARVPSERALRRREARTQRVLEAALGLVERHGLDGFTLADLAQELDYSPAALYRYFPSKDALFAELQRRVVGALARDLDELVERCDACDRDAPLAELLPLVAMAVHYDRFAAGAPELFGLLSLGLGHPGRLLDDEQAGNVLAAARTSFERIAGLLSAAASAGALSAGDPLRRAIVLWASLQGVAQLRKLRELAPDLLEPEPLLTTLVHSLFTGWGAAPEQVAHALDFVARHDLGEVRIDPDLRAADAGGVG